MCGRYVNVASTEDLLDEFEVHQAFGDDLAPSWNIAPTDPVRIVLARQPGRDRTDEPARQLRTVRWGLVPSWSRGATGGATMINARSETVASRPAFTAAAARRRCLVPALGYYEWMRDGATKTPYFLHDPDGGILAMAGLYEIWRDDARPDDDPHRWLWTCTVITRPAADTLGHLHERCPVIVPHDRWADWLDCRADDPAVADRLLAGMPEPHLDLRQVGREVGNVRNNSPELIEAVTEPTGWAPTAGLPVDLGVESAARRT